MSDQLAGPIKGIVLAAGMSRRLGRPKQLLELDGLPLIVHVVDHCLASDLDDVFVVVGHEAGAVRQALSHRDVMIVTNDRYGEGQASSLIAGLDAAAHEADGVVFVLADQPGIDPMAINRLIDQRQHHRASLAMAEYGGHQGHPVLFGREYFDELRGIRGDQGGREVIRRHRDELVLVPGGSDSVPLDIDTEDAYQRLLSQQPPQAS